jgi:hypothetical protein
VLESSKCSTVGVVVCVGICMGRSDVIEGRPKLREGGLGGRGGTHPGTRGRRRPRPLYCSVRVEKC